MVPAATAYSLQACPSEAIVRSRPAATGTARPRLLLRKASTSTNTRFEVITQAEPDVRFVEINLVVRVVAEPPDRNAPSLVRGLVGERRRGESRDAIASATSNVSDRHRTCVVPSRARHNCRGIASSLRSSRRTSDVWRYALMATSAILPTSSPPQWPRRPLSK